jgi:hypothetical protein
MRILWDFTITDDTTILLELDNLLIQITFTFSFILLNEQIVQNKIITDALPVISELMGVS